MQAFSASGPQFAVTTGVCTAQLWSLNLLDDYAFIIGLVALAILGNIEQIAADSLLHHRDGAHDDVLLVERGLALFIKRHRYEAGLTGDA